ncbi:hypothetical protein D0B54_02235 [Solimonas sp. K1W22B-7]|uniref:hypothetical protein n=1 Tax=Solimonas sp. K1W22B-7 TaxID=2303331 RepID=UPI000E3333A9|nr:hypothetical protein [Solimonas sp. K1W22B-7]AXQ27567.1 hypothetical protein D0B54_02235 [Solimonas sp. K1W22B-7]
MLLIAHGKTVPAQAPGRGPLAIRFGASIRCIALAAVIVLPARAAESPANLAAAVLELERQAPAADARQLTLYIGNRSEGSLLREVVVMVDGRAAARHRYSDREARALRAGLHPLVIAPLDEGSHRLRVEFVARAEDAQPGDGRQHAQVDQDYLKTAAAGRVELVMDKQGLRGKYGIQWQDWARPAPALEDPRLRAADYYLRSGQPLAAALLLERLRGEGQPLPAAFDRRMADSLAALDLAAPSALAGASPVLERYGRSVAALQQGDAQAAAQLEAIGAAEAQDGETLMLRDYANLELGYQLLRQGEGERAKPVLARVRSPGPCSNAALLGFGWAFLVPKAGAGASAGDGSMFSAQAPLWPAGPEDAARLRRNLPFRYLHSVAVAGERKLDLQRALIPWVELLGRDATDPAVQEGMLAVPYALAHLGAHEQSQQYSRRAVDQLERARAELDAAMRHVSGGELLALLQQRMTDEGDGWRRELADLPYADATAYLKPLMQDPAFLAALSAQQRLAQIDQAAARREDAAGVAALRQRIAAAAQAQGTELQDLALARLRAQRQHTLAYLAEARLALARVHDRPLEGEPS